MYINIKMQPYRGEFYVCMFRKMIYAVNVINVINKYNNNNLFITRLYPQESELRGASY